MPVPSAISDLSQTAGSNYPAGSESPTTADDYLRTYASYIAKLRDGQGFTAPVTLASATTTDIGGQVSQFVDISGTTTITSFGTNYNGPRYIRFTGALTLTHNATSLILPTGANITTVAGDSCIAYPNAALNGWTVVAYAGKSGQFATIYAAGGAFNGTVGATTPSTGAFTTLSASGTVTGTAVPFAFTASGSAGQNHLFQSTNGTQDVRLGIDGSNNCYTGTVSNHDFLVQTNGATRGVFSSTGLAVTGAISATGDIQTNNATYLRGKDASGNTTRMLGINASNQAYVGSIDSANVTILNVNLAGTDRAVFSSTGLAVTGALSATTASSVTVANDGIAQRFIGGTGRVRIRPYITTGNTGAYVESLNTAESAYSPLTLVGSSIYLGSGAGANAVTLDSSGNVGVGVTPSAWGSNGFFQIPNSRGIASAGSVMDFMANAYYNATYLYTSTAPATRYQQNAGSHSWSTAPSGTAGNAITFTQAMLLDASGNLGLGVTPSAWGASYKAIQIPTGQFASTPAGAAVSFNQYHDGTNYKYIATGSASMLAQDGTFKWYTAPSGTAGNAITFTQAMTLDASGQLGIGTASPNTALDVASAASDAVLSLTATSVQRWQLKAERSTGNFILYDQTGSTSVLSTFKGKSLALEGATSAAGTGIAFPATQLASSNANTLDDYEEGTFTPVLTFTTPGNLSVTYTRQIGRYVKVGSQVTAIISVVTSAFTHSTASGNLQFTGLPFSSASTGYICVGAKWSGITKATYTSVAAQIGPSNSLVEAIASGSGVAAAAVTAADCPTGGTVQFEVTISYTV